MIQSGARILKGLTNAISYMVEILQNQLVGPRQYLMRLWSGEFSGWCKEVQPSSSCSEESEYYFQVSMIKNLEHFPLKKGVLGDGEKERNVCVNTERIKKTVKFKERPPKPMPVTKSRNKLICCIMCKCKTRWAEIGYE